MYKKKEVINPERICALESCKKPFTATRENNKFCCHEHGEKDWRQKHPRIFFHSSPSWKAERVKPAKNPHRDTPQSWLKYMRLNPEYQKMVLRGESLASCCKSMVWS